MGSGQLTTLFALVWMVASAALPLLAFLISRPPQQEASRRPELT